MSDKRRAYVVRDYDEFLAIANQVRQDRSMSYQHLGTLVGTARGLAGRWMRGEHTPAARVLWNLAHALGYDIALIPRRPKEQP